MKNGKRIIVVVAVIFIMALFTQCASTPKQEGTGNTLMTR